MRLLARVDPLMDLQVSLQFETSPTVGTEKPIRVLPMVVGTQLVPRQVRFSEESLFAKFARERLVALVVEFMHPVRVFLDETFFAVLAEEPEIVLVLSFVYRQTLFHDVLLPADLAREWLLTGVGTFVNLTLIDGEETFTAVPTLVRLVLFVTAFVRAVALLRLILPPTGALIVGLVLELDFVRR